MDPNQVLNSLLGPGAGFASGSGTASAATTTGVGIAAARSRPGTGASAGASLLNENLDDMDAFLSTLSDDSGGAATASVEPLTLPSSRRAQRRESRRSRANSSAVAGVSAAPSAPSRPPLTLITSDDDLDDIDDVVLDDDDDEDDDDHVDDHRAAATSHAPVPLAAGPSVEHGSGASGPVPRLADTFDLDDDDDDDDFDDADLESLLGLRTARSKGQASSGLAVSPPSASAAPLQPTESAASLVTVRPAGSSPEHAGTHASPDPGPRGGIVSPLSIASSRDGKKASPDAAPRGGIVSPPSIASSKDGKKASPDAAPRGGIVSPPSIASSKDGKKASPDAAPQGGIVSPPSIASSKDGKKASPDAAPRGGIVSPPSIASSAIASPDATTPRPQAPPSPPHAQQADGTDGSAAPTTPPRRQGSRALQSIPSEVFGTAASTSFDLSASPLPSLSPGVTAPAPRTQSSPHRPVLPPALGIGDEDESEGEAAAKQAFFARMEGGRKQRPDYAQLNAIQGSAADADTTVRSTTTTPTTTTVAAAVSVATPTTPLRAPSAAPAGMSPYLDAELRAVRSEFKLAKLELEMQLSEVSKQRDEAVARLADADARQEAAVAEAVAGKQLEINELKRECDEAKERAFELEDKLNHSTVRRQVAEGGSLDGVSADELRAIEKEIRDQEQLMQGYQRENERLVIKIKTLESELKEQRHRLYVEHTEHGAAMRTLAQEAVRQSAELTDAELRAKLVQVTEELHRLRAESGLKETELRQENEKLRRGKRSLEAQLAAIGGGDIETDADLAVRLDRVMKDQEARHAAEVKRLRAKIDWYVENQQLLEAKDEELRALRSAAKAAGADDGGSVDAQVRARDRRIRQLEAQLAQAQDEEAKRHPNSLPALIRAAAPSSEESALVAQLREENAALQQALAEADDVAESKLRSLRLQHEKVKLAFDRQLAAAKEEADRRAGSKTSANRRIRELESQLASTRSSYQRKLRDAEARASGTPSVPAAAASSTPTASTTASAPASAASTPVSAVGDVAEPTASASDDVMRQLHSLREENTRVRRDAASEAETYRRRLDEMQRDMARQQETNARLERQAVDVLSEKDQVAKQLASVHLSINSSAGRAAILEEENRRLRKELDEIVLPPDAARYRTMRQQLARLTERCAMREQDVAALLASATAPAVVAAHAHDNAKHVTRLTAQLRAKDEQLAACRAELDSIVETLRALRHAGAR